MKVVLVGAQGMLGTDLQWAFQAQDVVSLSKAQLLIDHLDDVRACIRQEQPDLIINAAAYTNVDACENNVEDAYRVNAVGPRNLAVAAQEAGAALVHFSTDYVFAGDATEPQREFDPVGPTSIYGKSKLAGERLVQSLCPRHYILRTSWLYGVHGRNFVSTMLQLGQKQDVVRVVDDQMGSPTYTVDLANAVSQLVQKPYYGIYHLSNQGVCTWHQFAKDIFQAAQLDVRVEAMSSTELARPAKRPSYSVLDNQMWRLNGFAPLRPYRAALQDYLAQYQSLSGGVV